MKPILSSFRVIIYVGAGFVALFVIVAFIDAFIPQRAVARLRDHGTDLGRAEICANLLRGDQAAASVPIALKTDKRELRFADAVTWLAGKGPSPYTAIRRSPLFSELPQDLGPLQSCDPDPGVSMAGDSLASDLYLGYPKSRLTVTLRYSMGFFSTDLQRIEIGRPEAVTPATPPPGELERNVREFMNKLDGKADPSPLPTALKK